MKQWVRQAQKKLPSRPQAVRVINQQLWCCCYDDGIVILDRELWHQNTISTADMGWVWDVAEMSNGDVVIATDDGLYHYSNGECHILNDVQC